MSDPEVTQAGENGLVERVYRASVRVRGKDIDLGLFDTFEDAERAILAEESRAPSDTRRCPNCGGSGQSRDDDDCNMCGGTGRIPK